MSAYRAAPAPAGLPFPRTQLGLFTALVGILAIVAVAGPLALVSVSGGTRFLKEGGPGMLLMSTLAAMCAAALGILGMFVVRGKRAPMAVVAGLPAINALAGAVFFAMGALALLAVFGARTSVISATSDRAQRIVTSDTPIPSVDDPSSFEAGSTSGPTVRVSEDGEGPKPMFESYERNIVVSAHPKAKWSAVETAIRATISGRLIETTDRGSRAAARAPRPPLPSVAFEVAPRTPPDLSALGRYAMFFAGARPRSIFVSLEGSASPLERATAIIRPHQSADMQAVVDELATAVRAEGHGSPRLVIAAKPGTIW